MTNKGMIGNKCSILKQVAGSCILKNAHMTQLFMCIYLKLSDTEQVVETAKGPVTVQPGHVLISLAKYADGLGVHRKSISNYIDKYKELGIVTTEDMGRAGTLIKFKASTECCSGGPASSGSVRRCDSQTGEAESVGATTVPGDSMCDSFNADFADGKLIHSYSSLYSSNKEKNTLTRTRTREDSTPTSEPDSDHETVTPTERIVSSPSSETSPPPQPKKLGAAGKLRQERAEERRREEAKAAMLKPIPTVKAKRSRKSAYAGKEDTPEYIIAAKLIDIIKSASPESNGASATPEQWAAAIRRMLDKHSYESSEVLAMLGHVETNDRWSISTILGPNYLSRQLDRLMISYRVRNEQKRTSEAKHAKNNATKQDAKSTFKKHTETRAEAIARMIEREEKDRLWPERKAAGLDYDGNVPVVLPDEPF